MELQLTFNKVIRADDIAKRIVVEPEVPGLEIELGRYDRARAIHADWNSDTEYRIRVAVTTDADLQDDPDASRELGRSIGKPPKASGAKFTNDEKYYFPRTKPGLLQIKSRNLAESSISLYRLFPNNIVPAMQFMSGENVGQHFSTSLGQEIGKKTVTLSPQQDKSTTVALDISDILADKTKDVFSIQLSGTRNYQNTKIVLWTDIGAIAHWQHDALALYVHNIYTLEPIAGATVTVHSHKNQILATGITDAQGLLKIPELDTNLGRPKVTTIRTPDDFSFVELRSREKYPEAFASKSPYDADAYDAYLFADRNLYRPGETAHLRWLVRTNYGDALPDVPLMLVVKNSHGQEVLSQPVTLSKFGTGNIDFE